MSESSGEINLNLHHKQALALNTEANEVLFGGSAGGGKGVRLSQPVLTPFGWRPIGELGVGSIICATDGTCQRIIAYHERGVQPLYKLTWSDGNETVCDADHIWLAWRTGKSRKIANEQSNGESAAQKITTQQMFEAYQKGNKRLNRYAIPVMSKPCLFNVNGENKGPHKHISRQIPPYTLGVLIGDGCITTSVSYTCGDQEIIDRVNAEAKLAWGIKPTKINRPKCTGAEDHLFPLHPVRSHLEDLGLYGHRAESKFIPKIYLLGPVEVRQEILRGLMDTDGWAEVDGHAYFCTVSPRLADDVIHLARSLGCIASKTIKRPFYTSRGERKEGQLAYTVRIKSRDPESLFHLERKKKRVRGRAYQSMGIYLEAIEAAGEEETVCIEVSHPNSLFVTDGFIITHNSHSMRSGAILWCTAIAGLQVYLFRRIREDLVKNHMEGPKGFRAMLAPWVQAGFVVIVEDEIRFWNGSKIYLCHCKDAKDIYKYQGAEIHVLLIDELTHWQEDMYRFLRNRVRMVGIDLPEGYEGRFPRIFCSANPGNIGHQFVKTTFIDDCEPMRIRQMPQSEGGMKRQFIPARLEDNPSMIEDDPGYEQRLMGLGSEALVKAMRFGDWTVVDGAFFDCWSTERHVVRPFTIPPHWTRIRGMDWGSAAPFSVGWYAVVSESMTVENSTGGKIHLPRGCLVQYREWYGATKPNVGLKLTAEVVGAGIASRDSDDHIHDEVLDPAAFAQDGGPSIAEKIYEGSGKRVNFRRADNKRVGRRGAMGGWDLLRARLIGDGDGNPMLVFFSTCVNLIRTLPVIQHDGTNPEDLNSDMEDHALDQTRYVCASRPWTAPTIVVTPIRGSSEMTMREAWSKAKPKTVSNGRI